MIFHMLERRAWMTAEIAGEYRPPSLVAEGFIHFSTRDQVVRVANFHYRDARDLVLLEVDEDKLDGEVRYESAEDLNEKFPHLYAPLNLDAVIHVHEFSAGADGTYSLPPTL